MAVDWRIQGLDITTCSCDWGCPCQFMALPTQGFCHAAVGFHVAKGHYGQISLDGLSFGGLYAWPKAIHQGNGEAQPIVDARADAGQRDAILKIMSGDDTEPGATVFNVFAATYTKVHSPLFKPITVEADLAAHTARFFVDGVVDARIAPIRNPVTGKPSYARIVLPDGFEYQEAEVGSSSVRTMAAPIKLEWEGQHGHIARLDMTGKGLVRGRAA
ncbi:MAG TPA: DUF1326 domain-containing protein [Steroidobacteraceae bacterium]|jgi:hypothetical protein|nr:DUF1326 domain-containing protein [Steroidobacteraceae bacterium]